MDNNSTYSPSRIVLVEAVVSDRIVFCIEVANLAGTVVIKADGMAG